MNKYQIGYKRPPQETQFKSGQSGNPQGRPKGSTSFHDDLKRELNEIIHVTENGRKRKLTKQQAIIKRLVAAALTPDVRFLNLLTKLLPNLGESPAITDAINIVPMTLEEAEAEYNRAIKE